MAMPLPDFACSKTLFSAVTPCAGQAQPVFCRAALLYSASGGVRPAGGVPQGGVAVIDVPGVAL